MKKTVNISDYLNNINQSSNKQSIKSSASYNNQPSILNRYINITSQPHNNPINKSTLRSDNQLIIARTQSHTYNEKNTIRQTSKLDKSSSQRGGNNQISNSSAPKNTFNNLSYSPYYNRSIQQSTLNTKSLYENQRQLEDCIDKLKNVKVLLEKEIDSLQRLLDETSSHLQNSQEEFIKIKTKILQYTSKFLDAAFSKYKRNMPKWSKFEDAERKGIEVVLQVKECIQKEGIVLQTAKKQRDSSRMESSIKYTNNLISHYKNMHIELQKIRIECVRKRPTLNLDKIQCFQRSLQELCIF